MAGIGLITSRELLARRSIGMATQSHIHDDLPPVIVRRSEPRDARSLARVAGRDSKSVPDGPLLVAEAGGEVLAALPLHGGEPIADPFRPTAALVALLELRARQLRRIASRHGGTLAAGGVSATPVVRGNAPA
jgi:hypothetical protein